MTNTLDKVLRLVIWALAIGLVVTGMVKLTDSASGATGASWEDEWASADGIRLERIATGLELPTAVAVAETPSGVRYVVTELGGAIKTVTASGEVELFARVFGDSGDESEFAETGLAGVCLDPDGRFLFVTYGQRDANGILRNTIRRFELGDDGVAGPPVSETDISGNLQQFRSAQSHQIGGCVARDGSLFVSVGDGWNVAAARDPDALLGKVLRIDYDGEPAPGNPFGEDPAENQSYVWAYGFRNPWGIEMVGSDLFVAHNGHAVDTLVKVEPGGDHYWAGTDETIAINALNVWTPAIGPTQLSFAEEGTTSLGADWSGGFYVGTSTDFNNGLVFVPYDPETGRVDGPSRRALEHLDGPHEAGADSREQIVAAVAVEDGGVVFAGLFPDGDGETGLYRMTFDPENELANRIGESSGDAAKLDQFGCLGCHQFEGEGGAIGPSLDQVQLEERLQTVIYSEEYEQSLRDLDSLDEEPWVSFKDAREEVLNAEGDDRLLTWVKYRIIEPRFDRLESEMPTLGISESDAEELADFLVADPLPWWREQAINIFGSRESASWFALGAGVSAIAIALLLVVVWAIRRRRSRRAVDSDV